MNSLTLLVVCVICLCVFAVVSLFMGDTKSLPLPPAPPKPASQAQVIAKLHEAILNDCKPSPISTKRANKSLKKAISEIKKNRLGYTYKGKHLRELTKDELMDAYIDAHEYIEYLLKRRF